MATPVFGLTAPDLQNKIQPKADEQSFLISDEDGDMTEARAEEILAEAEDRVLMRIPSRYRQLCRQVDGEILVRKAAGGEASIRTGLAPIQAGTLRLWKNFPTDRLWLARDPGMVQLLPTSAYAVDEEEGEITLTTPLVRGDRLWGEYGHQAGSTILGLRGIALTLAAVEVSRQFAFFRDENGAEAFENWERTAYGDLQNLKGVDVLDRLELVTNETDPERFYAPILLLDGEGGDDRWPPR